MVAAMELMGIYEFGKRIGVSRQRAHQITRMHDEFPAPVARLAMGPIWRTRDIEQWITKWPRLGGRPGKVNR